jgi:hypothetical protein
MIYVVAGNHEEAYQYINRKLEERIRNGEQVSKVDDYTYVRDVNTLRGILNPKGVFIGSWKDRKDIGDIVQQLVVTQSHVNPVLIKILKQLKLKKLPLVVHIDGVIQAENTDYVSDGSFVTFNQAPPAASTVTITTAANTTTYSANGSIVSFAIKKSPSKLTPVAGGWINEALATDHAANMLAKAIDDEVLATVLKKINGGMNG